MENNTPPRRPIPPRPPIKPQINSEQNVQTTLKQNSQDLSQTSPNSASKNDLQNNTTKSAQPKNVTAKKVLSEEERKAKNRKILYFSLGILCFVGAVACFVMLFI